MSQQAEDRNQSIKWLILSGRPRFRHVKFVEICELFYRRSRDEMNDETDCQVRLIISIIKNYQIH